MSIKIYVLIQYDINHNFFKTLNYHKSLAIILTKRKQGKIS